MSSIDNLLKPFHSRLETIRKQKIGESVIPSAMRNFYVTKRFYQYSTDGNLCLKSLVLPDQDSFFTYYDYSDQVYSEYIIGCEQDISYRVISSRLMNSTDINLTVEYWSNIVGDSPVNFSSLVIKEYQAKVANEAGRMLFRHSHGDFVNKFFENVHFTSDPLSYAYTMRDRSEDLLRDTIFFAFSKSHIKRIIAEYSISNGKLVLSKVDIVMNSSNIMHFALTESDAAWKRMADSLLLTSTNLNDKKRMIYEVLKKIGCSIIYENVNDYLNVWDDFKDDLLMLIEIHHKKSSRLKFHIDIN